MSNKEDFWESLFKAGALIGGVWLAIEIIKALSKKVYRCPHCDSIIQEGVSCCPHCGSELIW